MAQIKTITKEWLKDKGACLESIKEWDKETDHEVFVTLNRLEDKNPNWANWLIVRLMNKSEKVAYAIFAAEQVIDIFEKKYPDDQRPRNAINAAKKYLEQPSEKNKKAAADAAYAAAAADAADAAADAAYAADAAAYAAAYAAAAAAYAADDAAADAADAADAAADAAYAAYAAAAAAAAADADDAAYAAAAAAAAADAAYAAYDAAYAAYSEVRKETQVRILRYGIKLLSVR